MLHNIEITVEVTHRLYAKYHVTDEEYQNILEGISDLPRDLRTRAVAEGASEFDYAVYDHDTEKQVVDWL